MNKIILLVAITTLLTQAVQAQIKRQYKDEKYAEQTVVVKEEQSMSDMEILNSQFDIDDVAVGDVIRITTEHMPEKKPEAVEQVTEEIVTAAVSEQQEVIEKEADLEETVQTTPKNKTRNNNNFSKSKKIKRKNPRFKKQKRKRVRNHKKKCYSF